MAVTLTSTGIQYENGAVQTTAVNSSQSTNTTTNTTGDKGALLAVSSYDSAGSYTWFPSQPVTTPNNVTWNTAGSGMSVTGSVSPYGVVQSTVPNAWSSSTYTTDSGTTVYAQSRPNQTSNYIMFGLTRNPGTSYTNIEYALYWVANGTIEIYESGTYIGNFGPYNTGYIGRVTYDGSYIRYYADQSGTRPIRIVSAAGLSGFKMQTAFYNGGSLTDVEFGSCTQLQTTNAIVKLIGGGGGAASYGESGGSGGYSEMQVDTSAVTSVAVTVGAAGGGVGYYAAGGDGGTSSFGAYCSATGGAGANRNNNHSGGYGGLGSGGNVNIRGGGGSGHINHCGSHPSRPGGGYFGGGGLFSRSTATKVYAGAKGGGGPPGLSDQNNTGGSGETGMVLVYTYK